MSDINNMRILTYKRTHVGDPNREGQFGIENCMGRVRNFDFDAVIGVGGIGREPKIHDIDRKINWVGINPSKWQSRDGVVEVTFEKFLLLDELGPLLCTLAPHLANRLYDGGARILLKSYSDLEYAEAVAILKWSLDQTNLKPDSQISRPGCQWKCRPSMKCLATLKTNRKQKPS